MRGDLLAPWSGAAVRAASVVSSSLVLLAIAACASRAPSHPLPPAGWYAHPDLRIIAVRVRPGETLFLREGGFERRGPVERLEDGICFMDLDGGAEHYASPEIRTRVDADEAGGVTLTEERTPPGECRKGMGLTMTRTRLEPITDAARIAAIEAALAPLEDPASCRRYDRCCADRSRKDWDVLCKPHRTLPQACWKAVLAFEAERPCR